jgi:hypothetical protein
MITRQNLPPPFAGALLESATARCEYLCAQLDLGLEENDFSCYGRVFVICSNLSQFLQEHVSVDRCSRDELKYV